MDRGCPGLCDLVRPVVARRVQAGRPIVVSEHSGGSPCLASDVARVRESILGRGPCGC